jgi:hypothetical protein
MCIFAKKETKVILTIVKNSASSMYKAQEVHMKSSNFTCSHTHGQK